MTGRGREQTQTPPSEVTFSRRELESNAQRLSQEFSQAFVAAPDFQFDAAQVFLGADSNGNPANMYHDSDRQVEVGRHKGLWHMDCDYSVDRNWRKLKVHKSNRTTPPDILEINQIVIQSKWHHGFAASRKPRITHIRYLGEKIDGKMTITDTITEENNTKAVEEAEKLLQDFLQTTPSAQEFEDLTHPVVSDKLQKSEKLPHINQ